jgi:hypothetical protein
VWSIHGRAAGVLATLLVPSVSLALQQSRAPRTGIIQGTELVVVSTDQGLDVPTQVDAGLVNIRLFNRGKALHSVILVKVDRLDRLASIAEFLRNNDWNVSWLKAMGGPGRITPGGISSAIVAVEPGRYLLADLGDGPPQGRLTRSNDFLRELSVVKGPGPAVVPTLPPTELTISMTNWAFHVTGALYAGRRTIRVANESPLDHNLWVVRLLPGRSAQDVMQWLAQPKAAMPFEPAGGTTAVGAGRAINVPLDLLPGEYVLICGLLNPLSQKTHAAHGMFKLLTVTH